MSRLRSHIRRQALRATTTAVLLCAAACTVLTGCASADRAEGPPQANGYASAMWTGSPPALNNTRVAHDR